MLFKPMSPTVNARLRYTAVVTTNGTYAATCLNIGSDIAGLADFTTFAGVFARFTIKHAKFAVYPYKNSISALSGTAGYNDSTYIEGPLAIGYFNDQVAPANPTTYAAVLADENARLVAVYSTKDTDMSM